MAQSERISDIPELYYKLSNDCNIMQIVYNAIIEWFCNVLSRSY